MAAPGSELIERLRTACLERHGQVSALREQLLKAQDAGARAAPSLTGLKVHPRLAVSGSQARAVAVVMADRTTAGLCGLRRVAAVAAAGSPV